MNRTTEAATQTNGHTADEVIAYMESQQDEIQRKNLMRFFKTAPGEYGEGDLFLGLKVPETRQVVKAIGQDIALHEIARLLTNQWHEVRLCGFLLLVEKFGKQTGKKLADNTTAMHRRDEIVAFYLRYAERANNWDLVDMSAPKILGHWLMLPTELGDKTAIMDRLAHSDNLWLQRISMVCTWKTLQMGDPGWCLRYAEFHLHHRHDLMHKAVGWMLREMGKRVSSDLLRDFLHLHAGDMPRTALRYAIEKLPAEERKFWMEARGKEATHPKKCDRHKECIAKIMTE